MSVNGFRRLLGLQADTDQAAGRMESMRPRFDRLRDRHTNGAAPEAVSAFQLFQTPAPLARRLVELLDLPAGARILEPSAGLGRILDALKPHQPAEVLAVEVAAELCGVLYRQDRPGVRILQRDFLAVDPSEVAPVDAVAMNPPFHLRADVRHVLHALRFLRPGGRLAALVMDTHHRAQALRDLADHWEPIPAGAFRAEGTETQTVLLSITKGF